MRLLFILSFSLILSHFTLAQDQVVLISGEVMEGKIGIDLPSKSYEAIVVKKDKKKTKLKAHQFISFTYKGDTYKPIKAGGYYRIMKEVSNGYLSLYNYREDESYEFATEYLYKKDGQGLYVPNFSFKNKVAKFLGDCPKIERDLENGKYKKKDLDKIVIEYNDCIEQNTLKSKLNVAEVSDAENPSIALIDTILEELNSDSSELKTLLKDIQAKLAQDKPIPDYLKSALKDQSRGEKKVKDEIEQLLSSI